MRIVFEKRESVSQRATVLVPIVSFVVSLVFGAILLAVSGANPFVTYAAMAKGAFSEVAMTLKPSGSLVTRSPWLIHTS